MTLVISTDIVLSDIGTRDGTDPNSPMIGWHNVVLPSNIAATSAQTAYPISNAANPLTYPSAEWRATSVSPQEIVITIPIIDPIDYVGIAAHNLGSTSRGIAIHGNIETPANYFELVPDVILPSDAPVIFAWGSQSLTHVKIILRTGSDIPRIAVIYVGSLLRLPRNIYVGHAPITLNRRVNAVTSKSVKGHFLGRIILGEFNASSIALKHIDPLWMRQRFDPFAQHAQEAPFFFAWRPAGYPREVGYAWATNDPQPTNQLANGMMEVGLELEGIV